MELSLEYWNSLANQFILISALLSGFSIAVLANLIVHEKNDKISNWILKVASISTGGFLVTLFAMTKILMMTTPGGYLENVVERDFLIPRLIGMLGFFLGLISISSIISLSGWTKSKKIGRFTTAIGCLTFLAILILIS
ncbi:hypothetical protein L3073_09755 [Ancylomarina sp. DW003]|nr:hypothetical protein [Ancylomarina sp. DW003]MDE5422489.1 hypothetical protein [Ancylomarina sp. DW003]